MAKHIILDCPHFTQEQRQLRQRIPTTDYQRLISDPQAAAITTAWFLHLNLLSQFSWAWEQ